MRLALDKQKEYAMELIEKLKNDLGKELVFELKNANQDSEAGINTKRNGKIVEG